MAKRKRWTDQDTHYLIDNFPHMHTTDIAQKMSRNIGSIYKKSKELGLIKSPKILEEVKLKNAKQLRSVGQKTRFKKGCAAFNKGKKMPDQTKEKIKKTWFSKGNRPYNTKPYYSEMLRYDTHTRIPYTYIKVPGHKTWLLKHRYIWEQHHGPIPESHIIEFIDGNTRNCHIENLRINSRNVQMLVNSIHKFPRPLSEVIILNNTLNKIIHEKQNPRS